MKQLTGSEKQIAWAESIRVKLIEKLEAEKQAFLNQAQATIQAKPEEKANMDQFLATLNKGEEMLRADIENQESAAWFIENEKSAYLQAYCQKAMQA
jgi:hypothetical protein